MILRIRWKALKLNFLYPFCCSLFILISIFISFYSIFRDHLIIKNIFVSIGNILSFIPYLISLRISKQTLSEFKNPNDNLLSNDSKESKYKSLKIDLEYNDELKEVTYIKKYNYFFFSFIEFLQNLILFLGYVTFSSNNNVFFWTIDILSIYFLSKCFLTSSIHRHHILCLIIFTFLDIYVSYTVITSPYFNYWQILFLFCNNFLYSFKIVYERRLWVYHFISPYKLCFITGILTLFYNIITILIETFVYEKYNISDDYKKYIDNFLIYWNKLRNEDYSIIIREIIFILVYIISVGLNNIFLYLTVNYLSAYHYLISKIFLSIIVNISFMIINSTFISVLTIVTLVIYALSLFILFIFIEIIELNFCNLNKNTKEQIKIRTLDKSNTFMNEKSIDANESNDNINNSNSINDSSSITYSSNDNNRSNLNQTISTNN